MQFNESLNNDLYKNIELASVDDLIMIMIYNVSYFSYPPVIVIH